MQQDGKQEPITICMGFLRTMEVIAQLWMYWRRSHLFSRRYWRSLLDGAYFALVQKHDLIPVD